MLLVEEMSYMSEINIIDEKAKHIYESHKDKWEKLYFGKIIAIDIDENIRATLTKRLARKKLDNVTVLESFEAFTLSLASKEVPDMDIICVEVIEHMEKAEATALIREVITFGKQYARTLIVTSPNADFNVNYGLDTAYRHDDHKFEFTEKEFTEWVAEIGEVCKETPAEIFGIGDTVDGVVTTLGVQFFF